MEAVAGASRQSHQITPVLTGFLTAVLIGSILLCKILKNLKIFMSVLLKMPLMKQEKKKNPD